MRNEKAVKLTAWLSKKDELLLQLELEKSKLNREKSMLLLDKALLMYFAFLIIGVVGFINKYLDARYLNIVIMLSFGVLTVGLIPYALTMSREEQKLNTLIANVRNRGMSGKSSNNANKRVGNRAAGAKAGAKLSF